MYLLHCVIFIASLLEIMTRFSFSKYEEAILSEKSRTSWFHITLTVHSNLPFCFYTEAYDFRKSYASVKKQKYIHAVVSSYSIIITVR